MSLCSCWSRLSCPWSCRDGTVAVVALHGVIGRLGPWHHGLSLKALAPVLAQAFKLKRLKAVALSINSPGGTPVQAALIAKRIRALASEHQVPVFAFAEDVAASGGYWLLAAADEIFADDSSLIGSIGVVSAGFGFPHLLERLGVERRVYTAGEHKAGLDPFQPERADEVEHLKRIQADIHDAFRAFVRERRGDRLKAPDAELFSGRFWSGRGALALGLIDGIGDLRGVMRARFGDKVRLRLIGDRRPWWQRRLGLAATAAPPSAIESVLAAVDDALLWQRFRM